MPEFSRLFAASLDLFCIANMDGFFIHLNPAWTALLGWTLPEMKACSFLDFVHPDDQERTRAEVGKLAAGAETILFENRYRHHDGAYRWLQWNARPVPSRGQIYAVARDITRQRQLEQELLEIVDHERERLGRELHDGLCQYLAGVAALSATLSRNLAVRSEPAASAMAGEITGLLQAGIREARNLARGLGPACLTGAGLYDALEDLARNVERLHAISCTLDFEPTFPRLLPETEAHLYRIAQEALNNAITHERADRIRISLRTRDGKGRLSIRGDALGAPDESLSADVRGKLAPSAAGTGLHTMTYRAHLIGGSLEVRQLVPSGVQVDCVFPLPVAPDPIEGPRHA